MAIEFLEDNASDSAAGAVNDAAPAAEPGMDAAAEPSGGDQGTAGGADNLDALLEDFDRAVGEHQQQTAASPTDGEIDALLREVQNQAAWDAERQGFNSQLAESVVALGQRDAQISELRSTIDQLQRQAEQEQWRQYQERSVGAFRSLVAEEQAKLKEQGLDVDEDFAERFLLAESAKDQALRDAWDSQWLQEPGPLERARIESAIVAHGQELARAAQTLKNPTERALAEQAIVREISAMHARLFQIWML